MEGKRILCILLQYPVSLSLHVKCKGREWVLCRLSFSLMSCILSLSLSHVNYVCMQCKRESYVSFSHVMYPFSPMCKQGCPRVQNKYMIVTTVCHYAQSFFFFSPFHTCNDIHNILFTASTVNVNCTIPLCNARVLGCHVPSFSFVVILQL